MFFILVNFCANLFQKINIDNAPRKFDRAMYLYPIQFSEISNSRKLVQNPGW
ncbi:MULTISPECIES: RagB/SusD family nutrient uptake outer membrane protein [Flavobacterium]|uniref:RagB/SusD family nutrient uptake outer membrane protein n=1 Tax=Flavobacterium ranwuense TaxID=2541725 RepID=A0ABY2E141_9FLAO|nr:RagB/SusD family nutrient uptake outer membrane protein [Flavobacterium ranwuense]TDE55608.1 RagB/SusD family nutrient uptake outer membrane protein [Flavobacterium sp. GT3P67]